MDIVIAVAIGFFTCALANMGVHVTLHPPEAEKKSRWKIGFGAAAVVICCLIWWQTSRNSSQQSATNSALASVQGELKQTSEQLVVANKSLGQSALA
jgi:H+/Cl- antiporter ClcA